MMANTKIEWATHVWNPITGCTKVSEGCRNCYAERYAKRFWGERKFVDVQCHENRLDQIRHWRKPSRIFVESMGDLFHPDVPLEFIDKVFRTWNYGNRRHTLIVLTKRPKRMVEYFKRNLKHTIIGYESGIAFVEYPDPKLWLGVSVEDQETADERIPLLLQTSAAVKIVSVEPTLGAIDIDQFLHTPDILVPTGILAIPVHNLGPRPRLDWVICGGETGPNARPMHPDWARSLRDQCQEADVPFFFKSWGEWIETWRIESLRRWIQKAQTNIHPNDVCIDRNGTIHRIGKEFMNARYPLSVMSRSGKKLAGRLLDGREWNDLPGG